MSIKAAIFTLTISAIAMQVFRQPANAQISEFKITAADGAAFDLFGISVSISGEYTVVGAWLDDDNGDNSGSAYVFKRTGMSWAQEAKLLPSDGVVNHLFGESVSISGDYALVGARGDDDNGDFSGSAYVFKRTGTSWAQEAKLLASDGAAEDGFGFSVSLSGDYVVVGAIGDDDNGDVSGSAYIFKRTGTSWAQEAKLLASDGDTLDEFGRTVSISGDYAIVGAHFDDDNGDKSGSAYVFKRNGTNWTQEAKLLASDGDTLDEFGQSVSISGDYAIVSAYFDDDNGDNSGSAYVFKRTGTNWAQEAKLLASDGATNDKFGYSAVSISDDYANVGAYFDDDNGDNSGSAYVYNGFILRGPPFVANPIQDVIADEDFGSISIALLDTVFDDPDLPDDSLRYTVSDSSGLITTSIVGDSLWVFSVADSNGMAEVVVNATDDSSASVSDTFNVMINPVNDPPVITDFPDTISFNNDTTFSIQLDDHVEDVDDPDSLLSWFGVFTIYPDVIILLSIGEGRVAVFSAVEGWSGEDSLKMVVEDTSGARDSTILHVKVSPPTGVADEGAAIPTEFALSQNYPNPFNPQTTIKYTIPLQSDISLIIYNLIGQEVMRWDEEAVLAGYYEKIWKGTTQTGIPISSGMYIYRIIAGDFVLTRKMVLLK